MKCASTCQIQENHEAYHFHTSWKEKKTLNRILDTCDPKIANLQRHFKETDITFRQHHLEVAGSERSMNDYVQ